MKKIIMSLALVFLLMGFVSARPVFDCSNYNISFLGTTNVGGGYYNWSYEVCQKDDPAISHWDLEACICDGYSIGECMNARIIIDYGSSLGDIDLEYGTDPHTGIIGFKFENWTDDFPDGCETFWIVISISQEEPKDVGLKAGEIGNVCIYGPISGPAHEDITVPEFLTPAIALAVLLTTPAFAYLLVKKRK